jgi:hypothetical protein
VAVRDEEADAPPVLVVEDAAQSWAQERPARGI